MRRLIVTLLACLMVFGFAFQGVAAQSKYAGTKLKMLAVGDTAVTRIQTVLDQFIKDTGIQIEIDTFPYPGFIDKIVVETSSKSPTYQLFWVDSPWFGQLGEAGALYDLTELAKRDYDDFKVGEFVPGQLQEGSWQGKLYGIPSSGMIWMNHYRKDLFENETEKANFKKKYGYDLAAPKTWAQFYDMAEFFTRKPGDMLAGKKLEQPFYGCAQAYSRVQGAITHDYFGIMRAFGGDFWDPETGLCVMNQEPHVKSAEFMKSLIPFNPPDAMALMWDLRTGYMERGECALSLYWSVRTVRLENPKEAKVVTIGDVGYAPNPTYEGKVYPTYTGALSYAINARASKDQVEAGWEFIKWALGEETCRMLAPAGISVARTNLLTDPELQEKYPYYQTLYEAQKNTKRRIYHPFYADVEEIFGLELNKYMLGEQTAQEALDKATQSINTRLNIFPPELRKRWVTDVKCEILK